MTFVWRIEDTVLGRVVGRYEAADAEGALQVCAERLGIDLTDEVASGRLVVTPYAGMIRMKDIP